MPLAVGYHVRAYKPRRTPKPSLRPTLLLKNVPGFCDRWALDRQLLVSEDCGWGFVGSLWGKSRGGR